MIIDDLFIDNLDHQGLEYWYNDIVEMEKNLKKK